MSTAHSYQDMQTIHWPSVIRHFRVSKGLKQAALADDLGVTQTMISRWEAGNADPSAKIRNRLFEMFWTMGSLGPQESWMDRTRLHPSIIGVIDSQGRQIVASRGVLRSLDVERHEVEDRLFSDMYSGDLIEIFENLKREGFFEGRISSAESVGKVEFKHLDGRVDTFWGHGLHRPIFMPNQQIHWLASGAAISEQAAMDVREKLGGLMVIRKAI